MSLIEFKNLPDTSTPLTAENLNFNFNEILNLICPIGKVETFFDNNDHSNYLGFTWERTLIGRVPVGIDTNDTDFDTLGETGGEKTHTLTINEMPSHTHTTYGMYSSRGTDTGTMTGKDIPSGSQSGTKSVNETGGDQPHNILQPYQVVAFWKRTA